MWEQFSNELQCVHKRLTNMTAYMVVHFCRFSMGYMPPTAGRTPVVVIKYLFSDHGNSNPSEARPLAWKITLPSLFAPVAVEWRKYQPKGRRKLQTSSIAASKESMSAILTSRFFSISQKCDCVFCMPNKNPWMEI